MGRGCIKEYSRGIQPLPVVKDVLEQDGEHRNLTLQPCTSRKFQPLPVVKDDLEQDGELRNSNLHQQGMKTPAWPAGSLLKSLQRLKRRSAGSHDGDG